MSSTASNVVPSLHMDDPNVNDVLPNYPPFSEEADKLAKSIDLKLSTLAPPAFSYGSVCIYKVAEKHRNKNPQAYTPRLVSIGPLHYGQSQLQRMEEYKLKYLSNFLHTFQLPSWQLAAFVQRQEKLIGVCYETTSIHNLERDFQVKLSEVLLLDGVFMVELLLKDYFREMRETGDIIFENPWVSKDIKHDLLLFENQLPMPFLSSLYDYFVYDKVKNFLDDETIRVPSFLELVQKYLKDVGNTGKRLIKPDKMARPKHLVEFLAVLHIDTVPNGARMCNGAVGESPRSSNTRKRGAEVRFAYCPTATQLLAAGVKFKPRNETSLFSIVFKDGELEIPKLVINDLSETFYRNLIAFEQTGSASRTITSYVVLLDNLIDTDKDVDTLIHHQIIENQLSTSDQVADLFNNLYNEVVTDPKEFEFLEVCRELNDYNKDMLHKLKAKVTKWKSTLRRQYFNNPWSSISVFAAVILLFLTIIQTGFSMVSYLKPPPPQQG